MFQDVGRYCFHENCPEVQCYSRNISRPRRRTPAPQENSVAVSKSVASFDAEGAVCTPIARRAAQPVSQRQGMALAVPQNRSIHFGLAAEGIFLPMAHTCSAAPSMR